MERLFLECAIRAFLLVAGTALVLQILRVRRAAARHTIWTGVLVMMFFLPAWTEWGLKVPLRILPPLAQTTASNTTVTIGTLPTAFRQQPPIPTWQAVLMGVYLLGLCLLIFRLAVGTIRARRLLLSAVLQDGVRTSPLCVAPVTVGLLRPAMIVPVVWRRWPN